MKTIKLLIVAMVMVTILAFFINDFVVVVLRTILNFCGNSVLYFLGHVTYIK